MASMKSKILFATVAATVAQMATAQIGLQEESYGPIALSYSHFGTDNIERIENGHRGSYDALKVFMNFDGMTQRIEAAAKGSIEYRAYSGDELRDETLGVLAAFADFALVPERFSWSVRESYGQGATDPFVLEGPGNRESINVLETGPELTLPLGRRTGIELAGQYSDRSYSKSVELDNELVTDQLSLFRELSRTGRFSISVFNSDIEYKNSPVGYQIKSAVAEYSKELASGNTLVQVGRNRIVFDTFDTSGPLYRFEWTRNVTARSKFELYAGQRFTDTGSLFGLVTGQIGGDFPLGILLTASPLQQREGGFTYDYAGDRNHVRTTLGAERNEYEVSGQLNNDTTSVTIEFFRTLNQDWRLGFYAQTLKRKFVESAQDFTDRYLKLWLNKKLGQRYAIEMSLGKNGRVDPVGIDENIYAVQFIYTPRPKQ